jgi:adenylate kinase
MDKVGKPTSVMIDIEVPEEELINRLISRGQVSGRSDDKIEVVKHRFEVYRKRTAPVKKYYQSINKYVSVDGVGTVEEVFERIEKVLSSL